MDWKNRLDQIKNKVKFQLNSRGVDNLQQLQDIFNVRTPSLNPLTCPLEIRHEQEWDVRKAGIWGIPIKAGRLLGKARAHSCV